MIGKSLKHSVAKENDLKRVSNIEKSYKRLKSQNSR